MGVSWVGLKGRKEHDFCFYWRNGRSKFSTENKQTIQNDVVLTHCGALIPWACGPGCPAGHISSAAQKNKCGALWERVGWGAWTRRYCSNIGLLLFFWCPELFTGERAYFLARSKPKLLGTYVEVNPAASTFNPCVRVKFQKVRGFCFQRFPQLCQWPQLGPIIFS